MAACALVFVVSAPLSVVRFEVNAPAPGDCDATNSDLTMFDAVALAEGFSEFASPNHIVILRKNGRDVTRFKVRYFDAVEGSVNVSDLKLVTGDTILVP